VVEEAGGKGRVKRKNSLVKLPTNNQKIDAMGIGLINTNYIQSQLFFNVDDLLGFETRRLYNFQGEIREMQVQSGFIIDVHTSYWKNKVVILKNC
jgi:hypothetical protein